MQLCAWCCWLILYRVSEVSSNSCQLPTLSVMWTQLTAREEGAQLWEGPAHLTSCLWVLGQRQGCTGCVLSPFSCRMSGMISGGHNPLGTPGSSSSQSDLASLIQA